MTDVFGTRRKASERPLGGTVALPILMYHALPATVGRIRTPIDIPLAEFTRHVEALTDAGWTIMGLTAAIDALLEKRAQRVLALTVDDGYDDVRRAADFLAAKNGSCTVYLPTDFVNGRGDSVPSRSHPRLTWDQAKDLNALGVELGSHSVRHRPLDVLPTEELRRELTESRNRLSDMVQTHVTSISYPYGYTSRRVQQLAAAAGYENGCTVGRRIAQPADRLLALPRLQPLPGMTSEQIVGLVERGELGITPHLKSLAQPAWRTVRFVAGKCGVELT